MCKEKVQLHLVMGEASAISACVKCHRVLLCAPRMSNDDTGKMFVTTRPRAGGLRFSPDPCVGPSFGGVRCVDDRIIAKQRVASMVGSGARVWRGAEIAHAGFTTLYALCLMG